MTSTFTIHLPRGATPGDPAALERAEFVRDGFAWGAFLVPGLWFLWHRHVVLSVLAFAVVLGSAFAFAALRLPGPVLIALQLVIHLFFGLEGSSLRRLAYRLRRRPMTGLVIAADEAEAETKGFARWLEPDGATAPLVAQAPIAPAPISAGIRAGAVARPGHDPVLGLFPDFEGRR